jgi:hypothetical protein
MTRRATRSFAPVRGGLALLALAWLGAVGCGRVGVTGGEGRVQLDYTAWNTVLARYVMPEGVNYAALRQHPERLNEALEAMRAVRREQFDVWTAGQRLAFLVNAHNAHAIARILRAYPVPSLEKTAFWGSAREARDIRLLGRRWSLRELADEVVSDRYLDARAIFLLNWAEVGCPALPPVAVTDGNLTDLLDRQPRRFLADERNCQYDFAARVIYLSPLIKEHAKSIERDFATLWEFLKRYLPPDQAKQVPTRPPRIRWLEFDPSLNDANLAPVPLLEVGAEQPASN